MYTNPKISFIELIYLKIYEFTMINFFRKIYGEQNFLSDAERTERSDD